MRRRCLSLYEVRLDQFSIRAAPGLRLSLVGADGVGLPKQSDDRINGDGLGYGATVLAISSDIPCLVYG